MPLTSAITAYNPNWPQQFDAEAARLSPVFRDTKTILHHVGSTAVPDLAAKPEIDILAVVADTGALPHWTQALARLGYRQGGDLSPDHHFFKRDTDGIRTHKLHICRAGHNRIARMLALRDHLRGNPADRQTYETLKLSLERANTGGIAEYLDGKAPFLDALFAKITEPS